MLIDFTTKPLSQLVAAAIVKGGHAPTRLQRIEQAALRAPAVLPTHVARLVAEELRFAIHCPALTNPGRVDRLVTEILTMREAAS